MLRKLYIAYRKDRKHDAFIENVVDYLLKIKNKLINKPFLLAQLLYFSSVGVYFYTIKVIKVYHRLFQLLLFEPIHFVVN